MHETVSVIVPTFDRAHLLPRAIESVLAQLEPGDELLVADDGSRDATARLVAEYGPPVRHLPLPHRGAGAARNAGWRVARGPLVAFLDSDDRWLPGKLPIQRALLARRPELVGSFGDFRTADTDGRERPGGLARWLGGPTRFEDEVAAPVRLGALLGEGRWDPDIRVHVGDFALAAMRETIVNIGTLVVRKARVGAELGCAEDLPTFEELPAVARILRAGPAAFLDTDLLVQHDHPGPRLTHARWLERAKAAVSVLERSWAADPVFLARHGEEFARKLRSERVRLARLLLAEGDTDGARRVLSTLAAPPPSLALLARMPGRWVAAGVRGHRAARLAAHKFAAFWVGLLPLG